MSLLIGGIVWGVVLVQASRTMHDDQNKQKTVAVGPLSLNQLSKEPLNGGGYRVGIGFAPGFVPYLTLWGLIGGVYGIARVRGYKHKQL